MKRHALRRTKDDDDETQKQADPVAAQSAMPVTEQSASSTTAQPPRQASTEAAPVADSTAEMPDRVPREDRETGAERSTDDASEIPLTETERRQRSMDNMQAIAAALLEHLDQRGVLPPPAIYDRSYHPLLSWRVALLPYLGHQDLYNRFRLDQPWDSPHNRQFLAEIPPVYQSPERFDESTNYLVPQDSNTAFPGRRGIPEKRVEDGLENTVLLLEANDDRAVPWTKPADYELDYNAPSGGLGDRRSGHFFVVWGDGSLGQVSAAIAAGDWKAMFTIDSGESFYASRVSSPAVAEVAAPDTAGGDPAVTDSEAGSPQTTGSDQHVEPEPETAPPATDLVPAEKPQPTAAAAGRATAVDHPVRAPRAPVPGETERQKALTLLRDLYRTEYEKATTADDKRDLAVEVLERADSMPSDSVDRFAALDLCRKIASQAGDIGTALRAAEQTACDFEVDELSIKADALDATVRVRLDDENDNETVLRVATALSEQALAREDYQLADRLIEAALAAARRLRDPKSIADVVAVKKEIDAAAAVYERVVDAIELLNSTEDNPHANLTVGAYYCFVKQRWDDGLPMLARGSNSGLAEVARRELELPNSGEGQIALADLWWELSENGSRYEQAMRSRAADWYTSALPHLDAGIQRVKAEVRIEQAASSAD
jgi:hypothetical protein